nr:DUF3455 domain-containing protein [uncultured Actinoplanes sp.]
MRKRPLKLAVLAGGVALAVVPAGLSFAGTTTDASTTPSAAARADSFTGRLTVPADLVPPAGNVLSSVFAARGVQVYTCANGAWTFLEPAASLTGLSLSPARPATALHFRGPSWESDQDGTLVEGMSPVSAPSQTPDSIPQLLLTARTTRGAGVFGGVTYIQRLATSGGVAPATACTGTETTGVPYRAVYRFFKARS